MSHRFPTNAIDSSGGNTVTYTAGDDTVAYTAGGTTVVYTIGSEAPWVIGPISRSVSGSDFISAFHHGLAAPVMLYSTTLTYPA
ncbi:MAG: hypothetical protein ACRDQZ_20515, partial [Mycobacteriales bacterium]